MEKVERILKPECRQLYSKLWDHIEKAAAIEISIPVVSERTGIGAEIIRSAISRSRFEIAERVEKRVNKLLICDCGS